MYIKATALVIALFAAAALSACSKAEPNGAASAASGEVLNAPPVDLKKGDLSSLNAPPAPTLPASSADTADVLNAPPVDLKKGDLSSLNTPAPAASR